jgi:hypothetical protein
MTGSTISRAKEQRGAKNPPSHKNGGAHQMICTARLCLGFCSIIIPFLAPCVIRKHWKALVPIGSHWNPSETIGSHLTNYAFHPWQASERKKAAESAFSH